ncbi:MAG: DUF364 domain-containing protein [Pseudomonadota bacterium]
MITHYVREYLLENIPEKKIADLRIGLKYTGVLLHDGNAGVAYTFRDGLPEGCSAFGGYLPLAGKSTHELLRYIGASLLVESSVGIATANALTNSERGEQNVGDVLDVLELGREDRVGMVGFFGPLVAPLRKRARELIIFEQTNEIAPGLLPAEKAPEGLPGCDVALITSTSLINGTLDSLIESSQKCREIVLLGASTLLLPELFKPLGVTLLSGVVVTDPPGILQVISEGGGMRFFKNHIKKVNIRVQG